MRVVTTLHVKCAGRIMLSSVLLCDNSNLIVSDAEEKSLKVLAQTSTMSDYSNSSPCRPLGPSLDHRLSHSLVSGFN